jgi:hypothetical protein
MKDDRQRDALSMIRAEGDHDELEEILAMHVRLQRLRSSNSMKSPQRDVEEVELRDGEACIICLYKRKEVVLAPCGHKAMCRGCMREFLSEGPKNCPLCSTGIESFVTKIYE